MFVCAASVYAGLICASGSGLFNSITKQIEEVKKKIFAKYKTKYKHIGAMREWFTARARFGSGNQIGHILYICHIHSIFGVVCCDMVRAS